MERQDQSGSPSSNQHLSSLQWARPSSYLSSSSVPGTPGVLSDSRSGSRARYHKRTKSSHKSETNLQRLASEKPRHRRGRSDIGVLISPATGRETGGASSSSRPTDRQDSEWLLRAGLALATSTREVKGQTWISKRESSTNLVADADREDNILAVSPSASRLVSRGGSRASRSGRSTPGAQSRRSSRSRGGSRRASRHDLYMTASAPATATTGQETPGVQTPSAGQELPLPDFVDADIRAEMEALQMRRYLEAEGKNQEEGSEDGEFSSSMGDDDDDSDSDDDYNNDLDEDEFQRLTRERGFGLGSWIDHYIGWALFGIDEEYSSTAVPPPDATVASSSRQRISFNTPAPAAAEAVAEHTQQGNTELIDDEDDHGDTPDEPAAIIEKPGEQGGWADANWLFRLARRTLV